MIARSIIAVNGKEIMIKNPVRGMRDISVGEMLLREYVLKIINEVALAAGYFKIETPAIDHLENLTSKEGGENEALIFKILKRGESLKKATETGDSLTDSALRYDLTVPLARYYSANSANLPSPFKSLQIGSVWRADAPQKGRFRQFTQCDMDILGDGSILAEIDIIVTVLTILSRVAEAAKVSGLTLRINDRRILLAAAAYAGFDSTDHESVLIALDKVDKIGLSGVQTELQNRGLPTEPTAKFLALFEDTAPSPSDFCAKLGEFVPDDIVIQNLQTIMSAVSAVSPAVKIIFDSSLVRGMGYYTGPIFECSLDGLDSSVAGGGRYDKMIGKFSGGNEVPACGFSIGFERIVTILTDAGFVPPKVSNAKAILVGRKVSSAEYGAIVKRAETLRQAGATVSVLPMAKNLGRQIELLEQSGFSEFEKIYGD